MKPTGSASSPTYDYFPDKGCSVAPACLKCPLPCCRYDDPKGYEVWRRQQRRAKARALIRSGVKASIQAGELAAAFGMGERQAWRILAEVKKPHG